MDAIDAAIAALARRHEQEAFERELIDAILDGRREFFRTLGVELVDEEPR
jgi:hypothetical protein